MAKGKELTVHFFETDFRNGGGRMFVQGPVVAREIELLVDVDILVMEH